MGQNNKGLRVLSLCGGIETGLLALKQLGIPVAEYHTYEILPEAIAVSKYHFPEVIHHGDLYEANWADYVGFDLVIMGTCCFTGENLVLTKQGNKPISEIKIGDEVLTHKGRWKKVINLFQREVSNIVKISTMQSDLIRTTTNHPFYVRRKTHTRDVVNHKNRTFKQSEWLPVSEIDKKYYVGNCINQLEKLPNYLGYEMPIQYGKSKHVDTLTELFKNKEFWWFVGRYIGDGWTCTYKAKRETGKTRTVKRVMLCCSKDELNELNEHLKMLNLKYNVHEKSTTYEISFSNHELADWLLQFGHLAHNKHLTSDILNLPADYLRYFLDGFLSADGCFVKNKELHSITTTSKSLAMDLIACINKTYNMHCTLTFCKRPKEKVIEGRVIHQKDTYLIRFSEYPRKQDKAFYEDGYTWCPIRYIENEITQETVYNIEVEDDNSYIVQNVIVHNCQSLSRARVEDKDVNNGLKGKSGIVYEAEKALNIIKPKWFMAENVIPSKDEDLKELNRIFGCNGILINSNLFGCQDRERYYWTNIPMESLPEQCDTVFGDIMEHGVDKKYFYDKPFQMIDPNKKHCANLLVNTMEMNKRIYNPDFKMATLTCINGGYHEKSVMDNGKPRKLTEIEYERCQGLPDNFTNILFNGRKLSYTKRCSLCGNGWTLPVIKHIFKGIKY